MSFDSALIGLKDPEIGRGGLQGDNLSLSRVQAVTQVACLACVGLGTNADVNEP